MKCKILTIFVNSKFVKNIPGLINSLYDFKDNCTCVIHCGTNDITSLPADVIANKLKDVVDLALEKNPNMNVIISNIVPRGDDHMIDITRQELNIKILKEFNPLLPSLLSPALTRGPYF